MGGNVGWWLPSLALAEKLLGARGSHGLREATSLRERIAKRAGFIVFRFRVQFLRSEVLAKRGESPEG